MKLREQTTANIIQPNKRKVIITLLLPVNEINLCLKMLKVKFTKPNYFGITLFFFPYE